MSGGKRNPFCRQWVQASFIRWGTSAKNEIRIHVKFKIVNVLHFSFGSIMVQAKIYSRVSRVIHGWWHRFGFYLLLFFTQAMQCSSVCVLRSEIDLKVSLSLKPNQCYHPLITQPTLDSIHMWRQIFKLVGKGSSSYHFCVEYFSQSSFDSKTYI